MNLYKSILRPFLFRIEPEKVHFLVSGWLKKTLSVKIIQTVFRKHYVIENPKLRRTLFNIDFPNPVGLAAGFDKDAQLFEELSFLGFGFIEIGTVTPLPQPGNDQPRMFRLPEDEGLINRMGFNNLGVDKAVEALKSRKNNVIIGGNIGKNKWTPPELVIADFEICFRALYDWVDYFAVNVSSPNTPGLRTLQEKEPLMELLRRLQTVNGELKKDKKRKPILLKIAPDLTNEQLDEIIQVILEVKLDGIIATNTTVSREYLKTNTWKVKEIGAGGLSGKPLKNRSTEIIKYIAQHSNKSFSIIGVGGIHSPEDAIEKFAAGADLIQLYTGFIYEGPRLIRAINNALIKDK